MIKRVTLSILSLGIFALAVIGMSAFEAQVINVTATIENSVAVDTDHIDYGTVYPQDERDEIVTLELSQSFIEQDRVDTVDYMIRQKPKCWSESLQEYGVVTEDENGDFVCIDGGDFEILPLLCPFLSKHEITEDGDFENDSEGINAFHGPISGWNASNTIETQVLGQLVNETDIFDEWNIDLRVPCFEGSCAQDWPDFVLANNPEANPDEYILPNDYHFMQMGCDLWIEVFGISATTTIPLTCGDGTVDPGEECDDNNQDSGDGCSSQCLVEFCGDQIVQDGLGEQCDDGNDINGDGCDEDCGLEICGNSTVDEGEDCDDGNLDNEDGCSDQCVEEECGDGILQAGLGEECDDGNEESGDGCADDCSLEELVSPGDVLINEVAWMGTHTSTADEWIELYNTTSEDIDITDWTLNATDGTPAIDLSGTIGANSYFLLERTDDTTVPVIVADQIYTGILSNTSDDLVLREPDSMVIDTADGTSGWPAGDNYTKQTMERCPDLSWHTSEALLGSPREENSLCN